MKKTIFSLVMMLFMAFSVCLTGCKETVLTVNPKTEETVISNGGMSVIKGDYLYFVNGYTDISDTNTKFTNKSNKWGSVGKSGIYRTKLNNGVIDKDDDGFLKNVDCVVPKVVGFTNGGFHIIDDCIYYATPNNRDVSSDGKPYKQKIEFHRVNINGSEKSDKRLFVTSNETLDVVDWTVRKVGDKVYLLVKDGSKMVSYNVTDNKLVAKVDVKSSAFYTESTYKYTDDRTSVGENYIYYTRDTKAEDNLSAGYTGNVIARFNITTGEIEDSLEMVDNHEYTIIHMTEDTVYYTIKDSSGIAKLYKKVVVSGTSEWRALNAIQLTDSQYDKYYFVGYGNDLILATDGTYTYRLEGTNTIKPVQLTSSRDILGIYGNYAYYTVEGALLRFDINASSSAESENITVTEEGGKYILTNRNFLDFDGQNLYVYSEYVSANSDSNYYLDYINNSTLEERFVGKFASGHIPAEPEQPEEETDENGDPVEKIPHID